MRSSKTSGRTRKQTEQLIGPTHHACLATISSFLRVASALRMGSPCQRDRDQITGETNCCIVRVTSENSLVQNEHLREDGASLIQVILPTTAQHDDVAVSDGGKYFRVKNIRGAKELVSHGFDDNHNADLCGVRLSVTSWPPLAVQWLCSNVFLAHQCKPRRVNRVAGLVAEGFSMHERLISPSQRTFRFSLKRSSCAKCGSRSGLTVRLCSTANGSNIAEADAPQDPVAAHPGVLWSGGCGPGKQLLCTPHVVKYHRYLSFSTAAGFNVSRNRIECGDVSLASRPARTSPFFLRRRDVCGRYGVRSNNSFFCLFFEVCHFSGLSGHRLNPHITIMTVSTTRLNDTTDTL